MKGTPSFQPLRQLCKQFERLSNHQASLDQSINTCLHARARAHLCTTHWKVMLFRSIFVIRPSWSSNLTSLPWVFASRKSWRVNSANVFPNSSFTVVVAATKYGASVESAKMFWQKGGKWITVNVNWTRGQNSKDKSILWVIPSPNRNSRKRQNQRPHTSAWWSSWLVFPASNRFFLQQCADFWWSLGQAKHSWCATAKTRGWFH